MPANENGIGEYDNAINCALKYFVIAREKQPKQSS